MTVLAVMTFLVMTAPPVKLNPLLVGTGPNTVSESTVTNTELSEFFGAH